MIDASLKFPVSTDDKLDGDIGRETVHLAGSVVSWADFTTVIDPDGIVRAGCCKVDWILWLLGDGRDSDFASPSPERIKEAVFHRHASQGWIVQM